MNWVRCETLYVLSWTFIGLGKTAQYLLRSEPIALYFYNKSIQLSKRGYKNLTV